MAFFLKKSTAPLAPPQAPAKKKYVRSEASKAKKKEYMLEYMRSYRAKKAGIPYTPPEKKEIVEDVGEVVDISADQPTSPKRPRLKESDTFEIGPISAPSSEIEDISSEVVKELSDLGLVPPA